MLCSATQLLQHSKQDTSVKLHLPDGQTKIIFLECLAIFPHLPLFGKDFGGLRGMLMVVPTLCLHPLHPSTRHIALHASLCDTGPLRWLSLIHSEVTQSPVGMYDIFHCLQKI